MGMAERNGSLLRLDSSRASRVLLGVRDLPLHQEVLDFLEREPRIVVAGAVTQSDALFRLIGIGGADATVVCPQIARDVRHPSVNGRAPNLLVVSEDMTVPVLREAIEAGATGVFAWPGERDELARNIMRCRRSKDPVPSDRGVVIAVIGARGGIGATFVACQLAASFADEGRKTVLVDADAAFADVTVALGVNHSGDVRTASDLLPVADEMSPGHLEDALHRHQRGFDALLAPATPAGPPIVSVYETAIEHLSLMYDAVVVHLSRSLEEMARMAISAADDVVLLTAPDAFSLHSARRAAEALGLNGAPNRCRVVINELSRGPVRRTDIEGAVGIKASMSIRFDPSVGRAQDRGQLLSRRYKGAARDVRNLARLLSVNDRTTRGEG